jgi:8-oxo-dGTP pyrophosphatase MutT (NUDIX family)
MGRPVPTGSDADEWRLWLLENAASGVSDMAGKIAAAMGKRAAFPRSVPHDGVAENMLHSSGLWPRITGRNTTRISPWVTLTAREVEFAPDAESQIYHSVGTFDYVVVLAITPDGRVPLVRQYRPAVEDFTLEFPAGIIDLGEDAAGTAIRELLEETGFPGKTVHLLGVNKTDAGRLSNRVHSYFIETETRIAGFTPEAGVETLLVTPSQLLDMIFSGQFDAQTDLGTLLLAVVRGYFKLPNQSSA